MLIVTKPCTVCHQTSTVSVDALGFKQWQEGKLIQEALPYLSADQRELLITGTHPECWDMMFGEEE